MAVLVVIGADSETFRAAVTDSLLPCMHRVYQTHASPVGGRGSSRTIALKYKQSFISSVKATHLCPLQAAEFCLICGPHTKRVATKHVTRLACGLQQVLLV